MCFHVYNSVKVIFLPHMIYSYRACISLYILELAVDGLKGRVFEVNMADLIGDEEQGYRKVKLCCEDIQGRNCLTDFAGLDMTRNHLCSLIRKWHTLIEAHVDVKTLDQYQLRIFAIAFSHRRKDQVKSTCYIRTSKVKLIRKKMVEVMHAEASKCVLKDLVRKIPLQMIEKAIEASTRMIFPLQNIYVRKIKVLKKPKIDATKLMEIHGDLSEGINAREVIGERPEAKNLLDAPMIVAEW